MNDANPLAFYEPHPDHPGWMRWGLRDQTRYNAFLGEIMVRTDAPGRALVRMTPQRRHSNLADVVHGGTTLGFIDVALFAASRTFGLAGPAVTLDLNTHFIRAGRIGEPMEAQVELLRETRRMIFLRGLIVQGADVIAEFSGTVRKSA